MNPHYHVPRGVELSVLKRSAIYICSGQFFPLFMKGRNMNNSDKITHHQIDLTLTRGEWQLMGFREIDGTLYRDPHAPWLPEHVNNACLVLAAASDTPAATYLATLAERDRHQEACRAITRLAESITAHGSAIEKRQVADVLATVLGRLTDRTQWAVRSQLKGTGMLP